MRSEKLQLFPLVMFRYSQIPLSPIFNAFFTSNVDHYNNGEKRETLMHSGRRGIVRTCVFSIFTKSLHLNCQFLRVIRLLYYCLVFKQYFAKKDKNTFCSIIVIMEVLFGLVLSLSLSVSLGLSKR